MTSSTDLKKYHISLLHYLNDGIRSARAIHRETKIPLTTVYYNINKLKQINSLIYRGRNGRPIVLCPIDKKAIGQYIRRNNEITVKEFKENYHQLIGHQYLYQQYVVILSKVAIEMFYQEVLICYHLNRNNDVFNGHNSTKIMILHMQYLQMKNHFNFSETLFVVGRNVQIMNQNEYRQIDKKSTFGVLLV